MDYVNLYAHDILQLNVARYLDRFKIFYERREKEWRNEKKTLLTLHRPVGMRKAAQWLSTRYPAIGLGTARSQVQALFEEHYQDLFGSFDRDLQSPAYRTLALIVWSGLFTESLFRHLGRRTAAFAKIARLLLVKAIHNTITKSTPLQASVFVLLANHNFGRRHTPAQVISAIKRMIDETVKLQRRKQTRDPTLDYSNFFKRNDLTDEAFKIACDPAQLRRLQHALEAGIGRMR